MHISRRGFMGSIASTIFLPGLIVRPKLQLHQIVAGFCSKHKFNRYDLDEPFVQYGHAYGTDAKAMARISTTDDDTSNESRKIPNALLVYSELWRERGRWRPLPAERLVVAYGFCPRCSQLDFPDCPYCDQWGCDHCNGTGIIRDKNCPVCHGAYEGKFPWLQVMGDKLINVAHFRKLQAIPGIAWNGSLPNSRAFARERTPILFKSDIGVDGMVMPVYPRR